ncbi:MAG: SUMF1/EgtB/PvdO family nonheme iron enzyme [Planctomycetes bacterium]|nr:SUMF1/EgtB/PvdO family nonheme iron enzyme [Planctomycetota bacterium]
MATSRSNTGSRPRYTTPMAWREATRAIRDAAAGLAAAHAAGLVHRDIKPANLIRTKDGVTKIVDFGLARDQQADTQLTQQGLLLGTPAYMAPEQWTGGPIDNRTDLYALTCTYYHLLTGHLPFEASSLPALGYQHRHEPFPDPRTHEPELPDAICRILARGSAKEPSERFQNAEELVSELEAVLASAGSAATGSFSQPVRAAADADPPPVQEAVSNDTRDFHLSTPVARTVMPKRRLARWLSVCLPASVAAVLILLFVLGSAPMFSRRSNRGVAGPDRQTSGKDEGRVRSGAGAKPPLLVAPFDAQTAQRAQQRWAEYLGTELTVTNSIGMQLILIPPGEFMMGSPASDAWAGDDEKPRHKVWITQPFYLGVTEVTQAQWASVMDTCPWQGEENVKEGPEYPATYMTWKGALEFCKRLSVKEGKAYRLPTEAEWEYACRAGTTTSYSFGNDASELEHYAWFADNAALVGEEHAHRVGRKRPNAFGLHDMHGNLWEWCSDGYAKKYYASSRLADPGGPSSRCRMRVRRGGSWTRSAADCRSANRSGRRPTIRFSGQGFRVVQVP